MTSRLILQGFDMFRSALGVRWLSAYNRCPVRDGPLSARMNRQNRFRIELYSTRLRD